MFWITSWFTHMLYRRKWAWVKQNNIFYVLLICPLFYRYFVWIQFEIIPPRIFFLLAPFFEMKTLYAVLQEKSHFFTRNIFCKPSLFLLSKCFGYYLHRIIISTAEYTIYLCISYNRMLLYISNTVSHNFIFILIAMFF